VTETPVTETAASWPRAMLDVETLATDTSQSVVVSLALLPFKLVETGPLVHADPLVLVLDVTEQLFHGRLVDPQTVTWWRAQDPAAAHHWLHAGQRRPLGDAMMDLVHYWERCLGEGRGELWANGTVFDVGNVESLIRLTDRRPPWAYNAARDLRTVYRVLPELRRRKGNPAGVPHDTLYDCAQQVVKLWERWPGPWDEA
jgi:hypothetical protein